MANIQNHVIKRISDQIPGHIHGLAGYYSDNDSTQHVVIDMNNDDHGGTGVLYEIHWNMNTGVTDPKLLRQFSKIHSLSGFYTSDDKYQHVIVATEDGWLHELYFNELYFNDPNHHPVNLRSPLLQDTITPGPYIGQAGFYSPAINPMRVITVGGADGHLHQVAWSASIDPFEWNPDPQFHLQGVAAIAGFFAQDVSSSNVIGGSSDVIVAMQGGDVFDVYSSGAGGSTTDLVTTSSHRLVNVAAFVSPDTHYRHVIMLDSNGQLYDYSYIPQQAFKLTHLASFTNVADIVGYYSAYDQMRHVIVATGDRNIHEVYYDKVELS